jgi:hypothetical protein
MTAPRKRLLSCAAALALCLVAPALVLAQGFSDDFESYTAGQPLPGPPWYSWFGGTLGIDDARLYDEPGPPPNGANGSAKFIGVGGEPLRWFTDVFDAKDRIVEFTFYVKSSTAAANLDMYAGSMEGTPGDPTPEKQYDFNIGHIIVKANIGDNTGWVDYAGQRLENFVGDAVTWNKIHVHLIARSTDARMGTGELFVNDVGSGEEYVWTLGAEGFNGVDFYGALSYLVDEISVVQNGFAAPLPYTPPNYSYPGNRGPAGGVTSDGVQYLYILGGQNTAATGSTELWRFDTTDNSWTQLPSSPVITNPDNPAQTFTWMASRAALTTAGNQGRLSLTVNANYTGKNPFQTDFDIETGAWLTPKHAGEDGMSSHDGWTDTAAAGDRIYGSQSPSQGGMLIYDAETKTFLSRQHSPNTIPGNWRNGNDMAYADDGNNWLYGLTNRDDDPDPEVADWVATIRRYDVTQVAPGAWDLVWYADLPVAWPNPGGGQGQHALTYVPDGINTIHFLHGEWGDAGLYEVEVVGGALFAAIGGSDDLYRYDVATGTWTTLVDAIPFVFGGTDMHDDMTFGCPVSEIPGDVDGNGVVDGLDLTAVLSAWDTSPGDLLWNPDADLDGNNVVNGLDLTEVISNWTVASAAAAPEAGSSEAATSDTTTKRGPGNVGRGKGNVKSKKK